ncbi:MAG: glycerol dehydrogenase [Pleomorphochaeta sp.]
MKIMGFPLIYKQGENIIDSLGTELLIFGTKAFIVSDPFIKNLYSERLSNSLNKGKIESYFVDFSGETNPEELDRISLKCKELGYDFVIGFGGGKSQDAAKAIKMNLNIPVVIIPTIASNDAATSRLIITYTKEGKFIGPRTMKTNPEAIFVDTSILIKAPIRYLIAGIGDALATYFEAMQCDASHVENFFGGERTEAALSIAKTCYEVVIKNAKEAVEAAKIGTINNAFDSIIEANVLLSGLGFEGCGVAGAHGISQGYTFIDGLKALHGEEVAVALLTQLVIEKRDGQFMNEMLSFYKSIGLPLSLTDLGIDEIKEEYIDLISEFASRKQSRTQNINSLITKEIVKKAIFEAEKIVQEYKKN